MESKWISEIPKFKDVEGYKISKDGTVTSFLKHKRDSKSGRYVGTELSKDGKILKGCIDSKGYKYVDLRKKDGKRTCPKIHRLVALAFLPNAENKPQINHIDGNKLNNRLENLEWCDNSHNQIHAYKTGLNKPLKNENSPHWEGKAANSQPIIQKDKDGNVINRFDSIARAARENGIQRSDVANAFKRKSHYAKNYYWYKG